MPAKRKSNLVDLWGDEDGTKAIVKPQKTQIAAGAPLSIPSSYVHKTASGAKTQHASPDWHIEPEMIVQSKTAVRTRPFQDNYRPNKRAAVAIPHPAQSYNPDDTNHQILMNAVAKKLEKKKAAHERFVAKMTDTGKIQNKGTLVDDGNWDEEVKDGAVDREQKRIARMAASGITGKKKKKKTSHPEAANRVPKVVRDNIRKSKKFKGQPDREKAVKALDDIDKIVEEIEKKSRKSVVKCARKRIVKREGLQVKNYGRYHFTALTTDVATSNKLVGSLRHMGGAGSSSGGASYHPSAERIKSLEERNVVPARMRHKFHDKSRQKRQKPKGDVIIRREPMGRLPDPDDHSLV